MLLRGFGRTGIRSSSPEFYQGFERHAHAVQHRRVLAAHALAPGHLEKGFAQLSVVQEPNLLLLGDRGAMNHRIGTLEQVCRVVQGPLQLDVKKSMLGLSNSIWR